MSSETRSEATPLRRFLVRLAPLALVVFLFAGGWYIYRSAPVELIVRFEVSPSFRVGDRTVRRESLVEMTATVNNDKGETLVRSSASLGAGLESPLSPPLHFTVPRGKYRVIVTFETADRVRVTRARLLNADRDGELRIDL